MIDLRWIRNVANAGRGSAMTGALHDAADEIERLTAERNELRRQLAEAELDAQRYRWLRGREDGRYMTAYAFRTDVDEVVLGEELDATIDAARAADMMVLHGTKVREG